MSTLEKPHLIVDATGKRIQNFSELINSLQPELRDSERAIGALIPLALEGKRGWTVSFNTLDGKTVSYLLTIATRYYRRYWDIYELSGGKRIESLAIECASDFGDNEPLDTLTAVYDLVRETHTTYYE